MAKLDSVARLAGEPSDFRFRGRTYKLHQLDYGDVAKIQSFVNSQFRDPFEVVAEQIQNFPDRFTIPMQKHMLDAALAESIVGPPKVGSAEAAKIIASQEGQAEIFYLAVSKGDPGFTRDEAREIANAYNAAHQSAVFAVTGAGVLVDDPKKAKRAGGPPGSPAAPRSRGATRRSTGTKSTGS